MKTKLFLVMMMMICCLRVGAQITLEHGYPYFAPVVQFKYCGDKYFLQNGNVGFDLYNLNHTLYKQIVFPPDTFTTDFYSTVYYVSENLFDNDSSTIDYFLDRRHSQIIAQYSLIANESGSIYFYSDTLTRSAEGNGVEKNLTELYQFISETDSGAKMWLYGKSWAYYIYSVPGHLYKPCPCDASSHIGIHENGEHMRCALSSYPNPASNKTTIQYQLPKGIHQAELKIISMSGVAVKSYKITDAFATVELDNSELPAGNYFYQIILPDGTGDAKKMMVIH